MAYRINNVWLPELKLVFALPRKSACTTMKHLLLQVVGLSDTAPGVQRHPSVHGIQCPQFREIGIEDTPGDCELIGVMREPVSRLWAAWQQVRGARGVDDFDKLICRESLLTDAERNVHMATQRSYLRTPTGRVPDRWLLTEHLDDDWAALCVRQGWPVSRVPHLNPDQHAPYRPEAVSVATRNLIQEIWSDDFVLYAMACVEREGLMPA